MIDEKNLYFVGHSRFERWWMAVLCLIPIAFFFLPLYVGWGPWDAMLLLYVGLCFALIFPLRIFLETFNNLYLYQEGIAIFRLFRPVQFLFWDDIAEMRGSVWSSDLIIRNHNGDVSCRVNSSFCNVPVLLHLLMYARPDLLRTGQYLTFTISPIPAIFLAVVLIALAFFGFNGALTSSTGQTLMSLLGLCLIIFSGVLFVVPYSVSILGDTILFRYPFRSRVLSAGQIKNITYVTRFDFIYEWGEVTIYEKYGDVIQLMFYNLGVSLLYSFLSFWHQMATMTYLPTSDALVATPGRRHRRLSEHAPYLLPAKGGVE